MIYLDFQCDEGRCSISSFFVCFLDVTDDPSHDSDHRTYESKRRMKLSCLSFSSSFEIEVDSGEETRVGNCMRSE